MQKSGLISDLEIQKTYNLIPALKYDKGMSDERECKYKADFVYKENGFIIVEDTKGQRTKDYIIKRKLFKSIYCQKDSNVIFKET